MVSDITFDDVMCIPLRQAGATPFTRPFLAFCVRRGWPARLGIGCHRMRSMGVVIPLVHHSIPLFHSTPFTRPFLAFCVRRGWPARLGIGCHRMRSMGVVIPLVHHSIPLFHSTVPFHRSNKDTRYWYHNKMSGTACQFPFFTAFSLVSFIAVEFPSAVIGGDAIGSCEAV